MPPKGGKGKKAFEAAAAKEADLIDHNGIEHYEVPRSTSEDLRCALYGHTTNSAAFKLVARVAKGAVGHHLAWRGRERNDNFDYIF